MLKMGIRRFVKGILPILAFIVLFFVKQHCCSFPSNCKEIQLISGQRMSGVYTIYPTANQAVRVFCDLETLGGAWTVIQSRGADLKVGEHREDFYRDWADYERGFGSPLYDYWLGLMNIHSLSTSEDHELRIELTRWTDDKEFVTYSHFNVSDASDLYRLSVTGFSGNIGDGLAVSNKMPFSTRDRDNENFPTWNCAIEYPGAWWFNACFRSHLNGVYINNGTTEKQGQGIQWIFWTGDYYSLKKVQMKIRPSTFQTCK